MSNTLVQRKMALNRVNLPVSYLTEEDIRKLVEACKKERDRLLITLLYQTGVRISEALALTPASIRSFEGKPAMEIMGKGRKLRLVALPGNLKEKLESYAYRKGILVKERFFRINRFRAYQIISELGESVLGKRVFPHLLRHSDAIIRLRKTGNPKALQYHLGHNTPAMTLRYLSTLTQEDALRVQQEVVFEG